MRDLKELDGWLASHDAAREALRRADAPVDGALFADTAVYAWGAIYEVASIEGIGYLEGLNLTRRLLSTPDLPDDIRKQAELALPWFTERIGQ